MTGVAVRGRRRGARTGRLGGRANAILLVWCAKPALLWGRVRPHRPAAFAESQFLQREHLARGHRGRPRHATRRAGGGVARRRDDIGSAQLDLREHVCAVAARVEALVLVRALVGGREEISQAVFQEDRDGGSVHRHADLRCAGNRGDQRFVGVDGPAALLRFALRPRVGCLLQPNLLELLLVVVHQGDV